MAHQTIKESIELSTSELSTDSLIAPFVRDQAGLSNTYYDDHISLLHSITYVITLKRILDRNTHVDTIEDFVPTLKLYHGGHICEACAALDKVWYLPQNTAAIISQILNFSCNGSR